MEDDGSRRRYRKQFATRAEAQEALDAKREELRNPKPKDDASSVTLGEALDRLPELKSRKKALREYEWIADHLKAALGTDTPLASITTDRIVAYKAQRLASKRGTEENARPSPRPRSTGRSRSCVTCSGRPSGGSSSPRYRRSNWRRSRKAGTAGSNRPGTAVR